MIPVSHGRRLLPHNTPLFSLPSHERQEGGDRLSARNRRVQRIGRAGTDQIILVTAIIIIVVVIVVKIGETLFSLMVVNVIEDSRRHTVLPALLNDLEQPHAMQANVHT